MPPSPRSCRFDSFTFDPASGDLHGATGTTRLQPQVAALLAVLIEHAGQVVTRAELQTRLWPDTTVEFDDGLNFCIRQLRLALGDDANAPRFIETLPKRGYRFLPAVTAQADAVPQPRVVPVPRRPNGALWIAGVLTVLLATVFLASRHMLPGQRAPRQRIVLAILPFRGDTTDPMMATYRKILFDQIVADAKVETIWESVSDSTHGSTYVLDGSVARDGNSVKLFVHLVATRDGSHLWADDLRDLYAFSGNSKMTADKIEKSVARILSDSTIRTPR